MRMEIANERARRTLRRLVATAGVVMAGLCAGPVHAAMLTVVNPSFEQDSIGDGKTPYGWGFGVDGAANSGIDNVGITPTVGEKYAYIYSVAGTAYGYFGQFLTGQTLTADTTYTLSVLVGHSPSFPFANASLALNANATRLATTQIGTMGQAAPGAGLAKYYTVTYTAPSTNVPSGDLLILLIAGGPNGNVELATFDDVTLSTSPIPEPGMLALLAIGGVLALRRRRR
jgi:hypothetical protein